MRPVIPVLCKQESSCSSQACLTVVAGLALLVNGFPIKNFGNDNSGTSWNDNSGALRE